MTGYLTIYFSSLTRNDRNDNANKNSKNHTNHADQDKGYSVQPEYIF